MAELKPSRKPRIPPPALYFPRLHRRGRIEASLPDALRTTQWPFHGFTAVAELKPLSISERRSLSPSFHGFTAVAELKPAPFVPAAGVDCFPRLHRRGRIEASHPPALRAGKDAFPRLHRRGRIEAPPLSPVPLYAISIFPRLHRRGRIEARRYPERPRSFPPFPRLHRRGRIEALRRAGQWRRRRVLSTASPPWPN